MTERIGARAARNHFADLVGRVYYGKQEIIIERSGKPVVAVIPVEMYEQLVAEREARFQILDSIRERLPDVSEEEVMNDVAEAVRAVRADDAARRP